MRYLLLGTLLLCGSCAGPAAYRRGASVDGRAVVLIRRVQGRVPDREHHAASRIAPGLVVEKARAEPPYGWPGFRSSALALASAGMVHSSSCTPVSAWKTTRASELTRKVPVPVGAFGSLSARRGVLPSVARL